jgi:hypothetical protein
VIRLAVGLLLLIWLVSLIVTHALYRPEANDFIRAIEVLTRYILGIPGALLAAWAIVLEQQTFRLRKMAGTGRDLLRAALALFFYGVSGLTSSHPQFPHHRRPFSPNNLYQLLQPAAPPTKRHQRIRLLDPPLPY